MSSWHAILACNTVSLLDSSTPMISTKRPGRLTHTIRTSNFPSFRVTSTCFKKFKISIRPKSATHHRIEVFSSLLLSGVTTECEKRCKSLDLWSLMFQYVNVLQQWKKSLDIQFVLIKWNPHRRLLAWNTAWLDSWRLTNFGMRILKWNKFGVEVLHTPLQSHYVMVCVEENMCLFILVEKTEVRQIVF